MCIPRNNVLLSLTNTPTLSHGTNEIIVVFIHIILQRNQVSSMLFKYYLWAADVALLGKCHPSMQEALGGIPSIA